MAQADAELAAFHANPGDSRFQSARDSADTIRRQAARLETQFRKNVRPVNNIWNRPNFQRRPLTIALISVCVAVYLLMHLYSYGLVVDWLGFSSLRVEEIGGKIGIRPGGLDDIRHGQVWRLFTPVLLHFNLAHILFDMWALASFGSLIEYRRGTLTLAFLILVSAVTSNLGQYLFDTYYLAQPGLFGGMSGVVYALFGYVWMKGRYEPEQGMILHPSSVQIMIFWLVICMLGAMGNIANAAHAVGLIVGMLCGLAGI